MEARDKAIALAHSCSAPGLQVRSLGQDDAAASVAFADISTRAERMRLEMDDAPAGRATIHWQYGDMTAVTIVEVISPPLVTIDRHVIVVREPGARLVQLALTLGVPDIHVRLARTPACAELAGDSDCFFERSSTVNLLIDPSKSKRPVEEVAFEVISDGSVVETVQARLVFPMSLRLPE